MLFCTSSFLAFFAVVFVVYWALPWHRARVWLLAGASLYFYASWNPGLALLMFASCLINYAIGLLIDSSNVVEDERVDLFHGAYITFCPIDSDKLQFRQQWLLPLSILGNIGLLCYFQYTNAFLGSLQDGLNALGMSASLHIEMIVPVGLSFYTFKAIGYVVDVSNGRIRAERDPVNFVLFMMFFPSMLAGPIMRAGGFLAQLQRPKRWDWLRLRYGLQLFLIGVIQKVLIADRMALYADAVFDNADAFNTLTIWISVVAYAVQIYCDFSGYSYMALGVAQMFGYKLMWNFNMPYLAVNIADFWQRWHISLSTWLREYVFTPLCFWLPSRNGKRGQPLQVLTAVFITFVLCGLWHGAAWTFVAWGTLHALFLIGHRLWLPFVKARPTVDRLLRTAPGTLLRIALTFLCVCIGWVFFRAATIGSAFSILHAMFTPQEGSDSPVPYHGFVAMLSIVILSHVLLYSRIWKRWQYRIPAPVWGATCAAATALALVLAPETSPVHLYFRF